ncbi:hypothetical protein [Tichowtungia aerotolerans]|uniref:Alpha/beta hydrolase n=1 Tax=Tichowtungia aerotolerans TaxID=2697043 RepID=A0A6P1M3B8_9BACT|nr:hypothetical protein [Tichowtungia aerotolerans]QHI69339.1 hypothetical protein GT409_07705 [Tichowtungia aerotolerans]
MKIFRPATLALLFLYQAQAVQPGDSRDSVIAELGEPKGSMLQGEMEVILFPKGTVTLRNGIVTNSDISDSYLQKARERTERAAQLKQEKKAELKKQKQIYPENKISAVVATYNRNEDWNYLPEPIRPDSGRSGYYVYLPEGYYESDSRYYPCLFVEHPRQWDSICKRVQGKKWAAVILSEQKGDRLGQKMNENFLAAYDDAVEKFRISRRKLFTAGTVPALLYATMRPVAGVILQEPDFDGLRSIDPPIDLIRKNSDMRVYALLGAEDQDNVKKQAQFITDNIPKYHIDLYDGHTDILPPNLADKAIDWMKKEYRLP